MIELRTIVVERNQNPKCPSNEMHPLVLHVITGLGTGGAETMLLKLVSGSRRYRHAIVSLTGEGALAPALRHHGAIVHALGVNRPAGALSASARLRRLVDSLRPAVVQGWMTHGNLAATWAARGRQLPLLWNVRQQLLNFQHEKRATAVAIWLSARLSGSANTIIYNSAAGRRDHERLGYPAATGIEIPNGFDVDRFSIPAARRAAVRRSLGVGGDELLIGLVARVHPYKNHPGFLAAAAKLLARPGGPQLRFLLAGLGTEPESEQLRSLLPEGALRRNMLLLGERHDMPDVTGALDIAVNCSFGEGFANALGEAMAAGVPCVASDVGDSAWIVGDAGLVVPAGDQERLEAALATMIDMSASQRARLGERAQARIIEAFSLPAVVNCYESLYEALADRHLKRAAQ